MKTKLLIFGISGDLGRKKLLPSLEQIIGAGDYDELSIIGVSRREIRIDDLLSYCEKSEILCDKTSVFQMDVTNPDDYLKLKTDLALNDNEQLLIYLSVPPQAVADIVEQLGEAGMNTPNVKILFEKPFGVDLDSALKVADHTSRYFNEAQVYRIDHYLAKEMAQNIITIRGKNALFSNIWNSQFIESIDIIATETIGIEDRANFYEHTGALRDVVQGHLIQLLALTLAEIPSDFDWDKLPMLRLAALNHLKPVQPSFVIRGQYEGYRDEVNNLSSQVETFVSLDIISDHPHWQGVPIKLITGKALNKKSSEIRVRLKRSNDAQSNCIVFRIHPNEGIYVELFIKKPGYSSELEAHQLWFNYPEDAKLPDPYEQVIVDAMLSRKSLFTSSEEVIQSWRILQPVQEAWRNDENPLISYSKGSDINTILA